MYLLTPHGTLVCRHRASGVVRQRPIIDPQTDSEPVSIDELASLRQPGLGQLLRRDVDPFDITLANGAWAGFRVTGSRDRCSLNVSRDGRFLSADPATDAITLGPPEAQQNERFLPLRAAEFDALRDILAGTWLIRSSGELVRPDRVGMQADFTLRLGSLAVDLRRQLPFDLSQWPHRLVLLRDGWRIEQICRYRPLIYYTVFGSPDILRQFALSAQSLHTAGHYDGAVAVLTDKSADEINRYLPADMAATAVVVPCVAHDRTAFLAARYAISTWSEAWRCQPLLYVDADILCDMDIHPLLHAVAMADRIGAPIEPTQALRTSTIVGLNLLYADGCSPHFEHGFNAGTLAIPNLAQHAATLALIGRILSNYCTLHGRTALPWVDQEVANYVSYRCAHFDTALVSRYLRLATALADPAERRGLVHFCWVAGADERVAVMQQYLQRLGALT